MKGSHLTWLCVPLVFVSACALDWTTSMRDAGTDGAEPAQGDGDQRTGDLDDGAVVDDGDDGGDHDVGRDGAVGDNGNDGGEEPPTPCSASEGCGEHATCDANSNTCICDDGYLRQQGACAPDLCSPVHGGPSCAANQECTVTGGAAACSCKSGFTDCDGECVDLLSDPAHCGTCEKVCGEGASCGAGSCQQLADQLILGSMASCALLRSDDGASPLRCWGSPDNALFRESPEASLEDQRLPRTVEGLATARGLVFTEKRQCALLADEDTLRCWGICGKDCGLSTTYDGSAPLATFHDIPVGGVVAFSTASGLNASAGGNTCYVRSPSFGITCRGVKAYGAITDDTYDRPNGTGIKIGSDYPSASALAATATSTCALLADGEVGCWGANNLGQLGVGATMAVTTDAGVRVQRQDGSGNLGNVRELSGTCAVTKDGKAYCWGMAKLSGNAVAAQAAEDPTKQLVKAVPVDGLTNVKQLSAGGDVCVLVQSGQVYCWGFNNSSPKAVAGLEHALEVRCGGAHCCARLEDGGVKCWGDNSRGQLGDGTKISRSEPVYVKGLE